MGGRHQVLEDTAGETQQVEGNLKNRHGSMEQPERCVVVAKGKKYMCKLLVSVLGIGTRE